LYASFNNSWGRNSVTVYYPATSAGLNRSPDRSGAPYPSVVFTGGYLATASSYTWLGNLLASDGYVVAITTVPNITGCNVTQWADAISGGITYLQSHGTSGTLAGMISGVLGVGGHSMGGAGALLEAGSDTRVSAVVAMAPPSPNMPPSPLFSSCPDPSVSFTPCYSATQVITAPTQIQSADADTTYVPPQYAPYYYEALTCPKELIDISNGTHLDWIDGFSNSARLAIAERYTESWFDYYLKGDTSDYTYIFGTGAQNDLASGVLVDLEFELHY
jgi:predicted dienelactone hydrolase